MPSISNRIVTGRSNLKKAAHATTKILLVDDEEKFLNSIAERLRILGFDPLKATGGRQALELAKTNRIHMAIVDLKMPDMDGLVTITKLKEIYPDLRSVLLTGYGSEKVKQATEALEADYFEKDRMGSFWEFIKRTSRSGSTIVIRPPSTSPPAGDNDPDVFYRSGTVEILSDHESLADVPAAMSTDKKKDKIFIPGQFRMIGETPAMQEIRREIERLAALDCTAIIRGETGTGKELSARMIHNSSTRNKSRFVAINCGCFSNDLLFEELLRNGRPTAPGSARPDPAVDEHEWGGTILLDQIEEMSPKMQLSMLKIIDTNNVSLHDGDPAFPFDVRILAASRYDLRELVEEGKFREELYYRLNVLELYLPPLRDRRDDITLLCSYFIQKLAKEFKKPVEYISKEVISTFMSYDFPGNVRELEHIIERAIIMADGNSIEFKHLPERFHQADAQPSHTTKNLMSLAEVEKNYILEVLEATGGNKTKATEVLGISRAALWRKLKQFEEEKHRAIPIKKEKKAK
jgi:two-component system response regulator AtoC